MKLAVRVVVILAVLSVATGPIPTASAAPRSLTFALTDRHIAQPVDWLTWCGDCVNTDYAAQQPWVVNPTNCMWDTDVYYVYSNFTNLNSSSLMAGDSAQVNECDYESWTSGQNGVMHVTDVD